MIKKEEIKVGQHYRSEKTKVLMTVEEINEEKDTIVFRIADSNFCADGPFHNVDEFLEGIESKLITEEEFQKYLETYTEDIREQQAKEARESGDNVIPGNFGKG